MDKEAVELARTLVEAVDACTWLKGQIDLQNTQLKEAQQSLRRAIDDLGSHLGIRLMWLDGIPYDTLVVARALLPEKEPETKSE